MRWNRWLLNSHMAHVENWRERCGGVVGGVNSREACDLRLGHGHYIFEKGAMLWASLVQVFNWFFCGQVWALHESCTWGRRCDFIIFMYKADFIIELAGEGRREEREACWERVHSITRMVISITALSLKLCNSLLLRAFPATYISNLLNKFKIPFTC